MSQLLRYEKGYQIIDISIEVYRILRLGLVEYEVPYKTVIFPRHLSSALQSF